MQFPWLEQWNNADCTVLITDDKPSENGDCPVLATYTGRCNLSEKSTTVRSNNGSYVKLACVIRIKGDIAPSLSTFSGKVRVNGREMLIETMDRPRNPDGTVHHTRLGLI